MPPGSPIDPKRHQNLRKNTNKYNKKIQKAQKKHGGGLARSAFRSKKVALEAHIQHSTILEAGMDASIVKGC